MNSFHLRFPEQVVLGEDVVFISLVYIYSQAIIFHELLFIVLRFAQEVLLVNLILIVVISIAKILIF